MSAELGGTEIEAIAQVAPRPGTRSAVRASVCRDVVLLGVGSIGRELLAQLGARRGGGSTGLRVVGLVDRSGYVFEPVGLSRRALDDICTHKRAGRPLRDVAGGFAANSFDAVGFMAGCLPNGGVLVDVTAADTHGALDAVLDRGWDVVLANKVPIAGAQTRVDWLYDVARRSGGEIRHEATVGAGLPVIDTLRKLIDAGDRVTSIEGCPSGTLGFLFSRLAQGEPISAALREAIVAGYTEPDPRVDLSGLDVARKALILARVIGYRGDLDSVRVESLVPESLASLPLHEFLERTTELDARWSDRIAVARANGAVLRYRVRVTRRSVRVGLAEVPVTDALSLLAGTDNQFAITTERYAPQPLVITGPGAGSAVTAAGVYNDLLSLVAKTRRGAARPARSRAVAAPRPISSGAS